MIHLYGPKKIDWYIFKRFILTFFVAILLMIVIVVIFDISEKIDDFVANQAPLKEIVFKYYLNFIPYFMNMFSPLFVFITVIFFTSRMAANSEIIAILSGGISFRRMMVPYMVAAALIAALSLCLNLFIIPNANAERVKFESKYMKDKKSYVRDIHYQIAPGEFVYVESFSTWNNTAYKMTIEEVDGHNLLKKTTAESASWDSTACCWRLKKYFERTYSDGVEETLRSGAVKDTVIDLTVSDFYRNKKTVETLNGKALHDLIETQKLRGDANVMYAEIERDNRTSLPFSAFILTIMGVALSSRKKRGGIGWNLALGIGLSFTYIMFMKFSQMFVYTGTLPSMLAIWMPNMVFTIVAVILYRLAPK